MQFSVAMQDISDRINEIDPIAYAQTRNFSNGHVTYLSPYISRGVISGRQIIESIANNGFSSVQSEKLIQELAWREYFQRVWQHLDDDIFDDIYHYNNGVKHRQVQKAIIDGNTGIEAIDTAIREFYSTGYMHNHVRMYVASITCNIGKAYWQMPSQWMYYHLLDGDLASNACSWQWVAGSFSSKKYYCNQENINQYTLSNQRETFLDTSYEVLHMMDVPHSLKETVSLSLLTRLPEIKKPLVIDTSLPLFIYNSYNLDPNWRKGEKANRVLLLEPSHFKKFPVSEKVIQFVIDLAYNIEGIQFFVGEVKDIPHLHQLQAIYSKEHPAFRHYPGKKDQREWIFPEVKGYYKSFFQYWKACLPFLKKKSAHQLLHLS